MSWSPVVNELVPRLADDDVAVRDAALEEALGLPDAELALVSDIDRHLSSWRGRGSMVRQGDRLWLGVPTRIVDDTVTRLVAVLRPCSLGLYDDVAPAGPRPRVLPAGWGHAGLGALSTTWPLASGEPPDSPAGPPEAAKNRLEPSRLRGGVPMCQGELNAGLEAPARRAARGEC